MSLFRSLALLFFAAPSLGAVTSGSTSLKECDDGVSCIQVSPSGSSMKFDCHLVTNPNGGHVQDPVFLLHGFPEWSGMYLPLMKFLRDKGVANSYACNQRGYSPEASPGAVEGYDYNILKADVLAIADELGHEKFHLVGHDHGGVLGWTVAQEAERVLSYTSLSIPHIDAFSKALYGPAADQSQQYASQYFDMFMRENSASIKGNFWYLSLGLTSGRKSEYDGKYSDYLPSDFQKALWWYNGAMAAGKIAGPPAYTATQLMSAGQYSVAFLRTVFGMPPDDMVGGIDQKYPTGQITVPSSFICGKKDPAILCDNDYAHTTSDYVDADYLHLVVDCAHDLTSCGGDEQDKINQRIWERIASTVDNNK